MSAKLNVAEYSASHYVYNDCVWDDHHDAERRVWAPNDHKHDGRCEIHGNCNPKYLDPKSKTGLLKIFHHQF
jgi:hypothetical protein